MASATLPALPLFRALGRHGGSPHGRNHHAGGKKLVPCAEGGAWSMARPGNARARRAGDHQELETSSPPSHFQAAVGNRARHDVVEQGIAAVDEFA